MTVRSQFSLTHLLIITAMAALGLLALVQPSVVWSALAPALVSLFMIFTVQRAFRDEPSKGFWLSITVGLLAYLLCVLLVHNVFWRGTGRSFDMWGYRIGQPIWNAVHPKSPMPMQVSMAAVGAPRGPTDSDFVSFCIMLQVFFATAFTSIAAVVVQLSLRTSKEKANS